MTLSPFRFGVQVESAGLSRAATIPSLRSQKGWTEYARRVEALGYDVFTMPDHIVDQLSPVPALMAAAAVTDTLRVGAMVLANDYRHPGVLAKELATIDLLSDGRLEVGMGAGWEASDYQRLGLAYDRPGIRIDRLVESIAVIRGLFDDGPFSYSGTYYTITDYDALPKPKQRNPPLVIGGGSPRILKIAARHADIVSVMADMREGVCSPSFVGSMSPDGMLDKIAYIREAAAGRPLELGIRPFCHRVTDDALPAAKEFADILGSSAEDVLASPYSLIGSPDSLVDKLIGVRETFGLSYVTIGAEDTETFAPVVQTLKGR